MFSSYLFSLSESSQEKKKKNALSEFHLVMFAFLSKHLSLRDKKLHAHHACVSTTALNLIDAQGYFSYVVVRASLAETLKRGILKQV